MFAVFLSHEYLYRSVGWELRKLWVAHFAMRHGSTVVEEEESSKATNLC